MIIVADSSPVNILIRIDCVDILPRLFGSVLIPPEVREELLDPQTPQVVRAFVNNNPPWLEVRSPSTIESSLLLDAGESAAISLALELRADALLIDEKDGRRAAASRGLNIIGTLGALDLASRKKLIDLPAVVARLKATDFRIDASLIDELLSRHKPH